LKSFFAKPDTHVPYHDDTALRLFCKVVRDQRPDILLDLGDSVDFWQLSFHEKVLARRDLQYELDCANEVLDRLDALPVKQKIITLGNHEYRWERALQAGAGPFAALRSNTLDAQLHFEARSWQVVPYKQDIGVGKLRVSHEYDRCGRNAHEQAIADVMGNALIGHTHSLGTVYRGNATGESHVGIAAGWLGDVDNIDYKHRTRALREWHLGFVHGCVMPNGLVYATAVPIIRVGRQYTCVVNGSYYSEERTEASRRRDSAQLVLFDDDELSITEADIIETE